MRGYLKVPLYPSACLSVFRLVSRLVRMPDMRGYLEVPLYQSADLFWACETCLQYRFACLQYRFACLLVRTPVRGLLVKPVCHSGLLVNWGPSQLFVV